MSCLRCLAPMAWRLTVYRVRSAGSLPVTSGLLYLNATTPVVICSCDNFSSVHALTELEVTNKDIIIELIK